VGAQGSVILRCQRNPALACPDRVEGDVDAFLSLLLAEDAHFHLHQKAPTAAGQIRWQVCPTGQAARQRMDADTMHLAQQGRPQWRSKETRLKHAAAPQRRCRWSVQLESAIVMARQRQLVHAPDRRYFTAGSSLLRPRSGPVPVFLSGFSYSLCRCLSAKDVSSAPARRSPCG